MAEMVSTQLTLSPSALKVLQKRYLKKDEEGRAIEGPENLLRRVAKAVASVELNYGKSAADINSIEDRFYHLMTSLKFLPNSPTLMNAGRRLGQLSACFVLPVDDSMESIFEAVKNAALIHKSGGGTGFSFSNLRPNGDIVGSTKGVSSGPISFMTVFDSATEAIKQGGTRRGANMGILRIDHPDILDFIMAKDNNSSLNNFNLSVALTDVFMKAIEKDEEYDLINPHTRKSVRRLKARDVFTLIVNHAWKNGEPGVIFMDRINQCNPTPSLGEIESTNPCGEQPLLPYESCNLGSINLAKFVRAEARKRESTEGTSELPDVQASGLIDWDALRETVRLSVHFLDNVIDINRYPLKKIEDATKGNRKIGLGIMGWADMLIQLGISYNSVDASKLANEVMKFIQLESKKQSAFLAVERGVFPNFDESIYRDDNAVRNATTTTIAPTGTLSIIAGCSSGIEPLFAVSFVRNVLEGTKLYEVNPHFERVAKERGFWSKELIEKIAEEGSLKDISEIPDDVKKTFITAHDISPLDHVRMQAAFQKQVDNAVSKTVNFTHDATPKDVEEVYMLAYGLGCKGLTVYRDGSREEQVLSTGKSESVPDKTDFEQLIKEAVTTGKITPRKRPDVIKGTTRLMKTGCGNLYVTINEDEEGNLFELFTQMGKAGGCASSQAEAIGRLVSLAFRSNIEPIEIEKQLRGISCHSPAWASGGKIASCSDAISKAIERYVEQGSESNGNGSHPRKEKAIYGACPDCGGAVEHEGGCAVCRDCGFTKCS